MHDNGIDEYPLIVGFYGDFTPHSRAVVEHSDAYGSFLSRSATLGFSGPNGSSWSPNEAGGADVAVVNGRIAWFQVGIRGGHAPLSELLACAWSILCERGVSNLNALQIQVPSERHQGDRSEQLRSIDAGYASSNPTEVQIRVEGDSAAGSPSNIVDAYQRHTHGHVLAGATECEMSGLAPETFDRFGWAAQSSQTYVASLPDWTIDTLAWSAEALVRALRDSGNEGTLAITMARGKP